MARKSKTAEFFGRKAEEVAQNLIGKTIERYVAGSKDPVKARIVVTGAYEGLTGNRTEQEGMFSAPGQLYIMNARGVNSLNIGTESAEKPSVVCIIGVQIARQSGLELLVGPGKVASSLGIAEVFNGLHLDDVPDLAIVGRAVPAARRLHVPDGTRIGTGQGANYVHYSSNCTAIYALKDLLVKPAER